MPVNGVTMGTRAEPQPLRPVSREHAQAFLGACRLAASGSERLLALHPRATEIRAIGVKWGDPGVVEVLFREAERRAERPLGDRPVAGAGRAQRSRASLEYYRARRDSARAGEIAEASRRLPEVWLKLSRFDAAEARHLVREVGLGLIGSALHEVGPARAASILGALPATIAAELSRCEQRLMPGLSVPTLAALKDCIATTRDGIAEELGMSLLSSLYTVLDIGQRAALDVLARSALPRACAARAPMKLDASGRADAVKTLLTMLGAEQKGAR